VEIFTVEHVGLTGSKIFGEKSKDKVIGSHNAHPKAATPGECIHSESGVTKRHRDDDIVAITSARLCVCLYLSLRPQDN